MDFFGLSALQVLEVLGAASAVVVTLYLLKLTRHEVRVPFVALWEKAAADKRTARLFSRLKRIWSLLLTLLIVALLALALGDPRAAFLKRPGRNIVLLVDTSESMRASDERPTRLQKALLLAAHEIENLSNEDKMLVATLDATANPETPLTHDSAALREGIARIRASDLGTNVDAGARLALDVLRGLPNPTLIYASDHKFEPSVQMKSALDAAHVHEQSILVGTHVENVAIGSFSVRRYPLDKSRAEVSIELLNSSKNVAKVELTLLGDGKAIDVQTLTLDPHSDTSRFFEDLSGVDAVLEAQIHRVDAGQDFLASDDHAYARVPAHRRAKILSVSPGNRYLEAALLLDEYLEVTDITPDAYQNADGYDVVIFDNFVPPAAPRASAIYLHPDAGAGTFHPFDIRGEIPRPFFDDIKRGDPLVRWTALADVNIARATEIRPDPSDTVIARDKRGPLLLRGTRDDHAFVALTFDVRESDLPLRVAWPLLLLNAIDSFSYSEAEQRGYWRAGDIWHLALAGETTQASLVDPFGKSTALSINGQEAIATAERAGIYELHTDKGDSPLAVQRASYSESNLEALQNAAPRVAKAKTSIWMRIRPTDELWPWLVLAALLLLSFEWISYHRRWTV